MQQTFLEKFALLFSLLLCLQQAHPYILRSHRLSLAELRNEDQDDEGVQNDSEDEFAMKTVTREKRAVLIRVIAGTTKFIGVAAALGGLGFDVYQHIRGCCDISKVCQLSAEHTRTFNLIRDKGRLIDRSFLVVANRNVHLGSLHTYSKDLWGQVNDLDAAQQHLITVLDDAIITKLNNVSTDIKIALERGDRFGSFGQFQNRFVSVFATAESTLVRMAPFMAAAVYKGITQAFRKGKITMTLNTASKVKAELPANKANGLSWVDNQWNVQTRARSNAISGKVAKSRLSKINAKAAFSAAGTAIVGLLFAAYEIWNIHQKVTRCFELERNATRELVNMRKAFPLIEQMKANITIFRNEVNDNFQLYRNQLIDPKFLNFTEDFVKMAQGALNQSSNLKDAVNVTKYFQKNIKTVSDEHISKLVKSLALAFANVTYKLNCETKKIQVVNHIYKECSAGNKDFNTLFTETKTNYVISSAGCVTSGYMTRASVQSYVFEKLTNNSLQTDCVLNDLQKYNTVCNQYILLDYSNQKNAQKTNLNISQVEFFINIKNCTPIDLTRGRKTEVCRMRWDMSKTLAEVKQFYFKFNQTNVADTYNNCPKKPCTNLLKKSICDDKYKGRTLAKILPDHPKFNETCMTTTYNTCPILKFSDPANVVDLENICSIIEFVPLSRRIYTKYKNKYGLAAVQALKAGLYKPGDLCKPYLV